MIEVKKEGILLSKTEFEFENEGVLNPAAIREGDNCSSFLQGSAAKEIIQLLVIADWMVR